jgi:hypothetical protein
LLNREQNFGPGMGSHACREVHNRRRSVAGTHHVELQDVVRHPERILLYARTDESTFNPMKVKADKQKMPHTLITGPDGQKYQTYELTAPGATKEGDSGKPWRRFDPN